MGGLLRVGGGLLLIGALLFSVGGYASFRRAQIDQTAEIVAPPDWLSLVPWVGLALLALGIIAVALFLFMLLRAMLTPTAQVGPAEMVEKEKPSLGPGRVAPQGKYGEIIEILNRSLSLEYAQIYYWPPLLDRMVDRTTAEKLQRLLYDSIGHAETVAAAVRQLGGTPNWVLESPQTQGSLRDVITAQLEKEKLVRRLHTRAAELAEDQALRDKLGVLRDTETQHIALLESVLSELPPSET